MWFLAAILVSSATPPNLFTTYQAHFLPAPYALQADCQASADSLNALPASSALPAAIKAVYLCVKI